MMRALSLWQPWATLVAIGAKKWETRSWPVEFRGQLAIHAAKKRDIESLCLVNTEPFETALKGHGLPLGVVLCTVDVLNCFTTTHALENGLISDTERAFGDYSPGRYCFELGNLKCFSAPVPARGMQRIWKWEQ